MGGNMSYIIPGVYLGGLTSAKAKKKLDKCGVTHICSIIHQPFEDGTRRHILFEADDSPSQNLSGFFEDACMFIHEARCDGGTVLIHCACGVSRSATVTLAYLLVVTELSLSNLSKALRGARQCVCPNSGFMNQLIEFERSESHIQLRKKLFSRFGEWPSERKQTDLQTLQLHMEAHEQLKDSFEGDAACDSGPAYNTACGTVQPETRLPGRLKPSAFVVSVGDKPSSLEDFLRKREERALGDNGKVFVDTSKEQDDVPIT